VFLCLREKCCYAHSMTADVPCREDGFVRRFVLSGLAFGLYRCSYGVCTVLTLVPLLLIQLGALIEMDTK
jgi:hypothetical protein